MKILCLIGIHKKVGTYRAFPDPWGTIKVDCERCGCLLDQWEADEEDHRILFGSH